MSKSIGNVVSPQDVMNKLGADIPASVGMSTGYTGEMTVSGRILQALRRCLSSHPQHRPLPCWPA